MKKFKLVLMFFLAIVIFSCSSCVVVKRPLIIAPPTQKHDNGLHKGWYKNLNNPHYRWKNYKNNAPNKNTPKR